MYNVLLCQRDFMFLFTLKKKKVSYCFPWGLKTELVEAVLKFRAAGVGAVECRRWPAPACESQFCTSLPDSKFSGIALVASHLPWCTYSQHGHRRMLQIQALRGTSCYTLTTSTPLVGGGLHVLHVFHAFGRTSSEDKR